MAMKQIFVLICFLLSITANSFCQTIMYDTPNEKFVEYNDDRDTIMTTHFYRLYVEDNRFVLQKHHMVEYNYDPKYNTSDTLLMSFGSCWLQGNELMMKDSLNGYAMKAVFDNEDGLQFIQGLSFTLKKTFCRQFWNGRIIDNLLPKFDSDVMDLEHFRNQKKAKKMKTGCYESCYDKIFNLMGDGRYVYYSVYPNDTLSKGRWLQQGSMLVFLDDGLTEPFYAGIENIKHPIVRGLMMPGAFYTTKFGKEKSDSYHYVGYDDNGPSKADLAKPLMGNGFINARFKSRSEENRVYELYFYEKEYSIEQIQYFDDVIPVLTLSYGKYTKEGNMLYLNDSLNGYQMTVELSADTSKLIMIQGYCSWIGKEFGFQDKTWHRPEFAYFFDFDDFYCPFEDYRNQKNINPYLLGNYQFRRHGNFPHELVLTEDSRYLYKVMDVLLLYGEVTRDGNLLILEDDCIDEPFFVLIEKNGLVPYLPGLFGRDISVKHPIPHIKK